LKLKKTTKVKNLLSKVAVDLGSKKFSIFVFAFFVVESVWIAFSAQYPQAFDENYHFGLIQTYSHYWLPFLSKQPPHANAYGAVAVDTSYFYHYLMSFPYRIIEHIFHGQVGQVISLRLIDVALFTIGLVMFRRLMLRVGLSRSLTNVSLLVFILIPIVPQLAAQVSYDDLFIPMTAWACLKAFDVIDDLKAKKFSSKRLIEFLIVCFFASIVKFAFLPIFIALALFLIFYAYRHNKRHIKSLFESYWKDFKGLKLITRLLLCVLLVISVGLVFQRDGLDIINYHSIEPNCSKVLSVKQCSDYSPWEYNYINHNEVLSGNNVASDGVLSYTNSWFYWMWYRLFFSINGITPAGSFMNDPPLPLPAIAALVVFVFGIYALFRSRRRIVGHNPYLLILLTVCVVYALVLYLQGYSTYKYTDVLENMNGRYLLPILLPIAALIGMSISAVLSKKSWTKSVLAVLVLFMFFEGGGVISFIDRSDTNWYWNNSTVIEVNNTAHNIAKHVVVTRPQIHTDRSLI
jgi:hypothetical protein